MSVVILLASSGLCSVQMVTRVTSVGALPGWALVVGSTGFMPVITDVSRGVGVVIPAVNVEGTASEKVLACDTGKVVFVSLISASDTDLPGTGVLAEVSALRV